MSKRDRQLAEREAAARALASEAETRRMLFDYDARMDRQAELDRQHRQQIVDEARSQLAQDRLEAEAAELDVYRATAVAQATSAKTIAPQFIPFIDGTSREEIDAKVQQAIAATAEIVSEIAGQGEPSVQSRDEYTGQFIPQAPQPTGEQIVIDKNLSMRDYLTKVRPAMNINERDRGIFG